MRKFLLPLGVMVLIMISGGWAPSTAETLSSVVEQSASIFPWWGWPLALFCVTFVIGVVAVMGGVGGGVLFVPIVSAFFPFHFDFVRGAGLFIALSGALSAGPRLLRAGLENLRLGMPMALVASIGSIIGAQLGLALPTHVVQSTFGFTTLVIAFIMFQASRANFPEVEKCDSLAAKLGICGTYHEGATGQLVQWKVHRTIYAIPLFGFIGIMAGMFGLGAGWANIPVLNLLMGAPLKISVATSGFIIAITDSSAAWVYFNNGAILPIIVAPAILGMMLGARIGAKLLTRINPTYTRYVVIAILAFSGLKSAAKGMGF